MDILSKIERIEEQLGIIDNSFQYVVIPDDIDQEEEEEKARTIYRDNYFHVDKPQPSPEPTVNASPYFKPKAPLTDDEKLQNALEIRARSDREFDDDFIENW